MLRKVAPCSRLGGFAGCRRLSPTSCFCLGRRLALRLARWLAWRLGRFARFFSADLGLRGYGSCYVRHLSQPPGTALRLGHRWTENLAASRFETEPHRSRDRGFAPLFLRPMEPRGGLIHLLPIRRLLVNPKQFGVST